MSVEQDKFYLVEFDQVWSIRWYDKVGMAKELTKIDKIDCDRIMAESIVLAVNEAYDLGRTSLYAENAIR